MIHMQQQKVHLKNGTGVAWANDNTEVIAFAKENEGYTIGIDSLGSSDTIAPAVTKGNTSLLDWLNEEIETLGKEKFSIKIMRKRLRMLMDLITKIRW